MNKRIEELATFCIKNSYETRINIEDFERFAKLIIKECLDIAEQTHETKYGKMRCANDGETVRLIKEHFGIE